MPWEKSFDEELAVEKAMDVFWQKGFEAASISDLLSAVDLSKGSFYNAFGDKRQLFVRSLIKYEAEKRRVYLAGLEALDDPVEAINRFFEHAVADMEADSTHKGCFLVNTSLEIADHEEDVKKLVHTGIGEIEAFFRRCIEVGQARGVISDLLVPETSAKILLSLNVAIRVLGRGAYTENSLVVIASEAKRLIQPA